MRHLLLAFGCALAAAGTAAACPPGLHAAATAELFFNVGDNDGGAAIGDWRRFVADEVTPRFPAQLTATAVFGASPDQAGDFAREPARALVLVLTGEQTERKRIEQIRAAYRDHFGLDSTLIMNQRGCVAL